jgi:hypothetical protein
MTKILAFNYQKKDGTTRYVELLPLATTETKLEGIDITTIVPEVRERLMIAVQEYDAAVNDAMKGYRAFIKEAITEAGVMDFLPEEMIE